MSKCQQPVGLSLMALSINTGYIMPSAPAKQFFCNFSPSLLYIVGIFLQCFDAVGWAAGRVSGLKKLSGEVLA